MNDIIFFMLGLLGLWIGSEFIMRGSLGLSRRLGWSEGFVGLVILSLGTDLPEIVVSITGAMQKKQGIDTSGIVVGNVIGSNMSQMVLVFGLIGLFGGVMKISKKEGVPQGISLILATLMFLVVSNDGLITQKESYLMLLAYGFYFLFVSRLNSHSKPQKKKRKQLSLVKILGFMIIGLGVIFQASEWVISHGLNLAVDLGVNQLVIGAILVGIGTSLPELVVSMNALSKGARELSVGNLVGSNVVDILLALGLGGTITSWNVDRQVAMFDMPFLLLSMVIVVLFMLSRKKLDRKESILMLALYAVYVSLKLIGW
jgi:cation:H+ antiporter